MDSETITISKAEFEALTQAKEKLEETEVKFTRASQSLKEKCAQVDKLQKTLDKLARMLFGKRSEKFNPDQLKLAFQTWDESDQVKPDFSKESFETPDEEMGFHKKPRRKRKPGGRRKLPEHLERETDIIEPEPEELVCDCCQEPKRRIGEDISERLIYVPAQFKVKKTIRPKYACPNCRKTVTTANPPYQAIHKGLADSSFLAHLLVQKYGYHLPLDRQRKMLLEHGLDFSTGTLSNWVRQSSSLLKVLARAIENEALGNYVVQFDETKIRVRDPTHEKKIRNGHLWLFCGALGSVVCKASVTKSGDLPKTILASYSGFIQADAATPFDVVYRNQERVEVGCWAHCRRYFENAAKKGDQACQWAIMAIAKIYKLDRDARRSGGIEELRITRETISKPIVNELFNWLRKLNKTMIESDAYYEGVRYALNQEMALKEFLNDPRLNLDNSRVERGMKRIAIGRKNWLFAGSPAGAERAAVIYSIVLSCQELELNLWDYLSYVMKVLPSTPGSQVATLTPIKWAENQSSKS
ncbi:MAG: IS66 family transposase [Planctomycetota bacterium]|nr:IS66 family transposase [Planctomycetota bacterium]